MAGFGNMNGDLEFYRLSDYLLIGKTNFYCGVTLNWSFDNRYMIGAVTSPRIRVDNEFKIFTHHGENLCGNKFTGEIYESNWVYSDPSVLNLKVDEIEKFSLEVSKEHLRKVKEAKEKAKGQTSTIRRLDMPLSGAAKKGNIPGLKK
jgi:uncharacterized protein with WD repeat